MASHWLQVSRPRLVVRLTAFIGCKSRGLSSAVRVLASYRLLESRPPVVLKSHCLQFVRAERKRVGTLRKGQVDISVHVGSVKGSVLHVVGVAVTPSPPPPNRSGRAVMGGSTVQCTAATFMPEMTLRWGLWGGGGRGPTVQFCGG
jgi:hypothetical protein